MMAAPFCRRRLLLPLRHQPSRSLSSSSVIDFLTDSCGLSASAAAAAAASRCLATLHAPPSLSNANAVLSLLRTHNFSPTQIASVVSARPSLLVTDPNVFLPKLRVLSAAAGGPTFLPALVTANPAVLHLNLDNHLIPVLDLLCSFTLSPAHLLTAVRRNRYIITCNFRQTILPNITLLLTTGVLIPHVSTLLATHPNVLMQRPDSFAAAVSFVQRFGLNPALALFTHAVRGVGSMGPVTLDKRLDRLRKLGWSEDDIGTAFRRAPLFLLVSDDKMERSVDFLVNTVGWSHKYLSNNPKLLMFSLEKRIMPRFTVFRMLDRKGLFHGKVHANLFMRSESEFLHHYVIKYSKELPELMDIYQTEVGGEELDSTDKESG